MGYSVNIETDSFNQLTQTYGCQNKINQMLGIKKLGS